MAEATKWAVVYDWRWKSLPVERITEKKVICNDMSYSRHYMRASVPAILDSEDVARRLAERLVSSDAQHADEVRKAGQRLSERNAAIIAGFA